MFMYRNADGTNLPVRPLPTYSPEESLCLKDRKWWAFLLSSIFTFLAGNSLPFAEFALYHFSLFSV